METFTVTDSRMYSLIFLYDLHTKLFSNVIDGISDEDAHNRLNTKANHIAWIAGSLVYERYELARALGTERKPTFDEFFKGHKGIQDNISYPSLADYKKNWEIIAPVLRDILVDISDTQLNSPFEMPGESMTFYDLIAFITDRESYYIGQIGLYRRLLGYEAMKYN